MYQENVYDDEAEFMSCKRACYETDLLQQDAIELISFPSTSKRVFGECGRRGGYMELVGIVIRALLVGFWSSDDD